MKRRTFLKAAGMGGASLALSTGISGKLFRAVAQEDSLAGVPSHIGGVEVIYAKARPIDLALNNALTRETKKIEFKPGVTTLAKGTVMNGKSSLPCDILWERDVAVPMRDGVKIYVDIFRPVGGTNLPAIFGYSPFGKQIPQDAPPFVSPDAVSGLQKHEAPDPGYWCNQGYAVINPDSRGAYYSEGDIRIWGSTEGDDAHDLIEWAGVQPWCNGKVAMSGNGWLGIVQWFTAASQPPHLAAIAPWEGDTDLYNQFTTRGGIPDATLAADTVTRMTGKNLVEDLGAMTNTYTMMNGYWQTKAAKLENIKIPAYIGANFGGHHTIDGFVKIASKDKWLRVHDTNEWTDYYNHENMEDLRRFFDRYLKGEQNGWEETPRVRLTIFDHGGTDIVNRPETSWPLARTKYTKLYLDGASGSLSHALPKKKSAARYTADDGKGQAAFTIKFDKDTELSGYFSLRLWMEAKVANDMDVFAIVQKLDADGKVLEAGFRYLGPDGRLRASHRKLDAMRSTPWFPVHPHDKEELLKPGQIVPLDIAIRPTSMLWHAGQQLQLVVAGYNTHDEVPPMIAHQPIKTRNKGEHIIYTGGQHDSHLLVPLV